MTKPKLLIKYAQFEGYGTIKRGAQIRALII